jgi:ATP phosphoribosyltransferase regulatory subunit
MCGAFCLSGKALMTQRNPWLLPEGIDELLPEQAKHLESLRRRLLDVFKSWGYQLVVPPLIDYLNSLLTGASHDLQLQTFKLTDQISGEMLGIRADMTPLVARIDAHNLKNLWPTRLCYVGTVLHTVGDNLEKTRSPMQIGAELYGHAHIESDTEVIRLMLEMLAMTGLQDIHLDVGHVGIFRELAKQSGLTELQETTLFDMLQRKAQTELCTFVTSLEISEKLKKIFLALPDLNGGKEVIATARQTFGAENETIINALQDMDYIAERLSSNYPALPLSFDMAELRGYHYHTGVVFAAFMPAVGKEIARGGRYDNIGEIFGRARPATGFSADLKLLSLLGKDVVFDELQEVIFAPYSDDLALSELIRELRCNGRVVIQQLPDELENRDHSENTSIIEKNEHEWFLTRINKL